MIFWITKITTQYKKMPKKANNCLKRFCLHKEQNITQQKAEALRTGYKKAIPSSMQQKGEIRRTTRHGSPAPVQYCSFCNSCGSLQPEADLHSACQIKHTAPTHIGGLERKDLQAQVCCNFERFYSEWILTIINLVHHKIDYVAQL